MRSASTFRFRYQDQLSDYIRAIEWSTKGSSLSAISAAGEVSLWKKIKLKQWHRVGIREKQEQRQPSCDNDSLDCMGISSNGQYLAVGGQAGVLWVWDIEADVPQLILEQSYPSIWLDQLAWNPIHSQLLALGVGKQVHLWNLGAKQTTNVLDFGASSVLGLTWSPSGQFLAVSGHEGVKIWNLEAMDRPPTRLEVPGASLCAQWSVNGQYLASGNLDRTLSILAWDSPPPWLMQGFPGKVRHVVWSDPLDNPGTPLVAAACMEGITIWQRDSAVDSDWHSHVLTKHQGFIHGIAFRPGTTLLASGGEDPSVNLWKNAKTVTQCIQGPKAGTACLAWSPSGNEIVLGGMDGKVIIYGEEHSGKDFG